MEYISVNQFAEKYDISERTARNYCAQGKIEGAFLTGKTWNIPADAVLPKRGTTKESQSPLLKALREQKASRLKGSIYHRTQIDLTYNSNHIEGSRLTHDQTRYIFETNTIGVTDSSVNVDDIVEGMIRFNGHVIIQTMFMKGVITVNGEQAEDANNMGEEYVGPWLEAVKTIRPQQVMIYTIDRETPDKGLQKATPDELNAIRDRVIAAGIPCTASY